ncbi:MAG TPA: hypothetical protein VGR95_15210 [Thermoanaerobaculia bacterium]|jgi:hypothetical protein|nr:hypothetical protein [Thermoanaerobaculia bacterium]
MSTEGLELASALLHDVELGYRQHFSSDTGIFLADLELAIDRFYREYQAAKLLDVVMPCLRIGESVVPIDWMATPLEVPEVFRISPGALKYVDIVYSQFGSSNNGTYRSPSDALDLFRSELGRFLDVRFAASNTGEVLVSGADIQRDTRLHYTPSYFIMFHSVIGSWAAELRLHVVPGRYYFGFAKPGRMMPTWERVGEIKGEAPAQVFVSA